MTYIEIKNWRKYQADHRGQMRDGPSPWIKDWTDKESDYEYSQLTAYQRYVYDGIRRLRGKLGKNPHSDPVYIARALDILPKERHCLPQAIAKLTALGLITLVESAATDSRIDKNKEDKEKEKNKANKPGSVIGDEGQVFPVQAAQPVIPLDEVVPLPPAPPVRSEEVTPPAQPSEAQELCELLSSYTGNPIKPDVNLVSVVI